MFFLFALSLSTFEDDVITELRSIRSSLNEIRSLLEGQHPSEPVLQILPYTRAANTFRQYAYASNYPIIYYANRPKFINGKYTIPIERPSPSKSYSNRILAIANDDLFEEFAEEDDYDEVENNDQEIKLGPKSDPLRPPPTHTTLDINNKLCRPVPSYKILRPLMPEKSKF